MLGLKALLLTLVLHQAVLVQLQRLRLQRERDVKYKVEIRLIVIQSWKLKNRYVFQVISVHDTHLYSLFQGWKLKNRQVFLADQFCLLRISEHKFWLLLFFFSCYFPFQNLDLFFITLAINFDLQNFNISCFIYDFQKHFSGTKNSFPAFLFFHLFTSRGKKRLQIRASFGCSTQVKSNSQRRLSTLPFLPPFVL